MRSMMPANGLPSPTTQLFGGNAGGGMAGGLPAEKKKPAAQAGLAPGATQTFAQMQQQGQARPAPAAAAAPAQQQPPLLSALNTQLNQPVQQQPAQPSAPKRQFTPQELNSARTRFKQLQDTGISNINSAAAQWGQGAAASPIKVGESIANFLEDRGAGSVTGGGGLASGGTYGAGYDENFLPTATWTPIGGVPQTIRQDFPEDLRDALSAAQAEDDAATAATAAAQPQQAQMYEQTSPALYGASQSQQPPAYQSSGAFGGSSQAQALRAKLEEQLNALSQDEAKIQGQSYEATRKAKMDEMGAEFGAQRAQIEEDLARRGLSASTIGGGRYGDLAGQQARATATFEADLLRQQAEAEAKNRQMYLSGMSELAGIAGTQDLGAFEANLKSRQADADISFRGQELQQEAALRGRELTLQEARDLATKEYQGGQLQQGYAEIGSRERISANELATRESMQTQQQQFERSQSVLERNLREKMQTQQLTSEEQRQLNQIDANKALQTDSQTFQAGQSQLERGLREKMQTQELTAAEKRQLAGIEADKAAAGVRNTFESGEAGKRRTFEGEQSQLDRDLRSKLSTAEIDAAQERFNKTYGLDKDRFGFEQGQSKNQFLGSLASVLAPMDQKKRDEFLAGLGITIPKNPAAGSVSGTTTGGGYGNDTGI